ncbi:MAG TPA: nucleotidyltransferase domain-containing protein [Candidatus Binatia bacterium]|nr:nucleotidyltransferase domain-containing protein [Candidatus Binatia bacterium]
MPSVRAILDEALAVCKPGPDDLHVMEDVRRFLDILAYRLKKQGVKARVILGGSFAKDTWLKGDYDVDIFVAFDEKHAQDNLSDLLEKAMKQWKAERVHGSRDYFQIHGDINYEIIPVLDIEKASDAQNVTDFSPKHVAWVNRNAKGLTDDIRLLKKFCKAQKVYGAESYIRGFSGHVVDILIIHYGGFLKLLRAARGWKPKTVLDINKVYKGKALLVLNASKTQGPLIVIDPVQPERNAAAALTQDMFDRFIDAARKFLARPSIQSFHEHEPDLWALKQQGALIVEVATLSEKEDIAGTKMVKLFAKIKDELARHDFTVADAGWTWDREKKGGFWFRTKEKKLSPKVKRVGPPKKIAENAKAFKKKYPNARTLRGRLVALIPREFRTPAEVIASVLRSDYAKDKVVSARLRA